MNFDYLISYFRFSTETDTWNRNSIRTTKEMFKQELRRLETSFDVDRTTIVVKEI